MGAQESRATGIGKLDLSCLSRVSFESVRQLSLGVGDKTRALGLCRVIDTWMTFRTMELT